MLTNYPLFFAFMGDMLGGGFVLALGGFFATLAAVDTANPYGPMGASRTRMVGFLAEPVFMIVFFTVSFVAGSTIPYIVQEAMGDAAGQFLRAVARAVDAGLSHVDPGRRRAHSGGQSDGPF